MNDAFEILETAELFLIDFYLPQCPPCKRLAPILKEWASESGIPVVTVNLKEKRFDQLSDRFGVKDTPTVVAIWHREEIARSTPVTKKDLYRLVGERS
jgi:thiol-disulfide isomerase/thioredoxin